MRWSGAGFGGGNCGRGGDGDGDAAYGAAATRREFLNANKELVAKVPGPRENVQRHHLFGDLSGRTRTGHGRQIDLEAALVK